MPLEFDITLTVKDMYRFNLYQNYTGTQGFLSVLIAAVGIFGAVRGYGWYYPVLGAIGLFYLPLSLFLRSKQSLSASSVLSRPLHYLVDGEGIHVSQGEESATLPWENIYKISMTKSLVLVYSSRIHAYVIPREQLRDKYGALASLAAEKLPNYRNRLKLGGRR